MMDVERKVAAEIIDHLIEMLEKMKPELTERIAAVLAVLEEAEHNR